MNGENSSSVILLSSTIKDYTNQIDKQIIVCVCVCVCLRACVRVFVPVGPTKLDTNASNMSEWKQVTNLGRRVRSSRDP